MNPFGVNKEEMSNYASSKAHEITIFTFEGIIWANYLVEKVDNFSVQIQFLYPKKYLFDDFLYPIDLAWFDQLVYLNSVAFVSFTSFK